MGLLSPGAVCGNIHKVPLLLACPISSASGMHSFITDYNWKAGEEQNMLHILFAQNDEVLRELWASFLLVLSVQKRTSSPIPCLPFIFCMRAAITHHKLPLESC